MKIKATAWNSLLAKIRSARPLGGVGVRVTDTTIGSLVSADPSGGFEHPWKLNPMWRDEEWRVFVRPGFVNGLDATIGMGDEDIGLTDKDRPYLTPGWRNPLASRGMAASLVGDLITLPGEGYPKFFESIGVRPANPGSRAMQAYDPQTEVERTRELRACDIALVVPRVATNQQVDIHDPFSEAQTVTISTVFNDSYARSVKSKYRLRSVPKWELPKEPTAMDRLMGQAVEPQTDEIKIATLWMVSPPSPEGGEDAQPDGSWMAYPQYNVFWNLCHAPRRQVPAVPPKPITLHTGLLGGLADSIFNAILAPINDANSKVQAFLNATTFKGEFWTV